VDQWPFRVLLLASKVDPELRRALDGSGGEIVSERTDSRQALTRALEALSPDVVLSDPLFAPVDTIAALDVIRTTRPAVPLIVVAKELDEEIAVACLRAGAEDIVLKSNAKRLQPAIAAALAVRRPLSRLSPRQLAVWRLLSDGHPTKEIARRLAISVKTVETHRSEVMRRLDIHNVAGLTRYAVRVGLVLPDAGRAAIS
jgi:DNA-binding NarL/FixJ family response regulator